MSIDTSPDPDSKAMSSGNVNRALAPEHNVEDLIKQIGSAQNRRLIKDVFGPPAKTGGVYRWGVAVSTEAGCSDLLEYLSRLACGASVGKRISGQVDLDAEVDAWIELVTDADVLRPYDGAVAVLWAASLPGLIGRIESERWQRLLDTLLDLHESILQRSDHSSPLHLLIGGELGMTLGKCLRRIPACKKLRRPSVAAVRQWCRSDGESVSRAIAGAVDARLVLASLIRCRWLDASHGTARLNKKSFKEIGESLATWVAAMTVAGGGSALSRAERSSVRDDFATDGLMDQAAKMASDSLKPAFAAALGASPSGGRLAWQVSLPESLHHDLDAKLAVFFPDWDVRRGRVHVDYSQSEVILELFAGRASIVAGKWEALIEINGHPQQSCGDWEEVCEYTDDDVHYLEIEQAWTGGLLLQRQIMLVRDDRSVLLADAVLPSSAESPKREIRYSCRLPLPLGVVAAPEPETREITLSSGDRRGMAIPLAASEWRVGQTNCTLAVTEDHHMTMMVQGQDRLYAPLWFDLQQRRFRRKRTWRQLTVGDQLRIVGNEEAVGYRIQQGSEQWMVYRSLADQRCRTALGKHLIADFYCSRFDAGDGSHEELITVDDSESNDNE